jgi:hypothetical protein
MIYTHEGENSSGMTLCDLLQWESYFLPLAHSPPVSSRIPARIPSFQLRRLVTVESARIMSQSSTTASLLSGSATWASLFSGYVSGEN